MTLEYRPDEVSAPSFDLEASAVTSATASLSGSMGAALKLDSGADEWLDVSLRLREGRVVEAPLKVLRERVFADDDVARLRARGRDPEIVVRSYEATCDLVLKQRSQVSANQWLELKKAALKSRAELEDDGSLVFRGHEPSVIAYETLAISIVADSMGADDHQVVLTETLAENGTSMPEARPSLTPVVFASIASARYGHARLGDVLAATNSSELMGVTMAEAGVQERMSWAEQEPLDSDTLFSFLRKACQGVSRTHAEALVVYWVGHSLALSNGQLYLVMGDYLGDLDRDIGSVERRDKVNEVGQPLAGSNIEDLVKVLQAVEDRVPAEVPGLVPLVAVHDMLADCGVPFAILVDGCYPSAALAQLRAEMYLTEWGDYFGPDLSPDMGRYSKALSLFGKRPYLASTNPVVLAAKPGTLAIVRSHPWNEWDFGVGVGPIAAKVAWNVRRCRGAGDELTWGRLLSLISDEKGGLGEMSVRGSITWSDLAVLDGLPLF